MTTPLTTYTDQPPAVASPTTTHTFTHLRTDSNGGQTWVAPGAGNDLVSRLVLKRAAQKTKAGIVGRTSHLTIPRLNAITGKYDSSVQVRITINAPATADLDECYDALFLATNLHNGSAKTGYVEEFVEAADLPA